MSIGGTDAQRAALDRAVELLRGRRIAVLTGAGISTESGIPDYRGPVTRLKPRRPIQHREFVGEPKWRARYWARSALGWPRFRAFQPNSGHHAMADLTRSGQVTALITQNVDRLHHKAGARNVIELHGSLYEVRCLACERIESRDELQERLLVMNPTIASWPYALAPDGDADIPDEAVDAFRIPPCQRCGGVLKPDVVFFGDNVPLPRVEQSFAAVEAAEAVLIAGTSLAIWSGYRFAVRASERGLPIVIVNVGETRADPLATVKLDSACGELLPELIRRCVG